MASLLERMNISSSSAGPTRNKPGSRSSTPYNRNARPPKRDTDSPWTHDMYESGSLSARLGVKTTSAPKLSINALTQKALQEANVANGGGLSIKGAGSSNANVVEVSGLVGGTTAEDVAAIFKRCGDITNSKLVQGGTETRVRLTFKTPSGASTAVKKFHDQPADGKVLSVRLVGSSAAGSSLGARLGGVDGLGLVRDEGSVDVLMDTDGSGSKMRSDSLRDDPRAQVLVAPPGADPSEYTQRSGRGGKRGAGRGRGGRRGRGRGLEARMDTS